MSSLLGEIKKAPPGVREELAVILGLDASDVEPDRIEKRLHSVLHHASLKKVRQVLEFILLFNRDLAWVGIEDLEKSSQKFRIKMAWKLRQELSKPLDPMSTLPIEEVDIEKLSYLLRINPDPVIRASAAKRLGELSQKTEIVLWRLRKGLEDPSLGVVKNCLQALLTLDAKWVINDIKSIFQIIAYLKRPNLIDFLAQQGDIGIRALMNLIRVSEGDTVVQAAKALIQWSFEESFKLCRQMLTVSSLESLTLAVPTIGLLGRYYPAEPVTVFMRNRKQCISLVEPLLNDGRGLARLMSFLALAEKDAPNCRNHARRLLKDNDMRVRKEAVNYLGENGEEGDLKLILSLFRDPKAAVREAAADAASKLAPNKNIWLNRVRQLLKIKKWGLRKHAIELLAKHGSKNDLPLIAARFKDQDEDVREAALRAAADLDPENMTEFALELLTDDDSDVSKAALDILEDALSKKNLIEMVLQKIPSAKGGSGPVLLNLIKIRFPDRWNEAIDLALRSKSEEARKTAIEELSKRHSESNIPILKKLLKDKSGDVRLNAMKNLCRLVPKEAKAIALSMLEDSDSRVRLVALKILGGKSDQVPVDDLLPLARDEDEDVRCQAIKVIAKFYDVRVFSELLSSLNDVDDNVRKAAQKILNKQPPVPSVARLSEQFATSLWQRVKAKVDNINRWASHIGQELLGKPVIVFNYRQGLGRTPWSRKKRNVEIEVTDTSVTSGHPYGEDIMRGLVLHEIGHHLYHFGIRGDLTMRGIARSEGLGEIYDFLRDEQLERALRSRRPEWGIYFDRLASYAFAQDTHLFFLKDYAKLIERSIDETRQAILQGEFPGELVPSQEKEKDEKVALREGEMLSIPGLVPVHAAFFACLRCGFDPAIHPDPRVAQAIDMVPANLKDMELREVLEVAKKIGNLLGRSDRFKKDMKRFQQQIREHREIMRQWSKALERMAETGQLPDWLRKGAPGIRKNLPASQQTLLPKLHLKVTGGQYLNLGKDLDFPMLEKEETLPSDPSRHAQLVATIRKHIRRMRGYFERLGLRSIEQYASRRGRRLDLAQVRDSIVKGSPNLLVHSREEMAPDAYIGVLVDRSGSMEGKKIDLAKVFGVLVAESLKGLRGIKGHVNAFDDDTFIRMGNFQRNAIASLTSGGGNNDSGALAKAAELALRSGKRNNLLIMISDGSPTECTVESLKNLIAKLTRNHGIICAQVAVEEMEEIAFPHYVDLSQYPMDEAVARFGNMLMQLTAGWR